MIYNYRDSFMFLSFQSISFGSITQSETTEYEELWTIS